MTAQPDFEPDDSVVLQTEDVPLATIPVGVEGPVRVQALPRKSAGGRTLPAVGVNPVMLFPADPLRAEAVLISSGPMIVAFSQHAFGDDQDQPAAVIWPANVPFVCRAVTELWARSGDPDTGTPGAYLPISVSAYRENWAQG